MNGAGNDFIILNNLTLQLPSHRFPLLAKTLCERHLSIGADGLMVVDTPESDADFKMRFYNADGSLGEMCGNGARCICRYGYEQGLSGPAPRIETTAGIVTGQRISESLYKIRLNDPSVIRQNLAPKVDGVPYPCAYVELGNPGVPHLVVPYTGLAEADLSALRELGRKLRWHSDFPKGANVNFYEFLGADHILEKTFERGVEDFTYACGTGTGSVAAVLMLKGKLSGRELRATMTGGELLVTVETEGARITDLYLTGPTNIAAKGQVTDAALAQILP